MLPSICVIGAGSSGLAVTKALKDAGLAVDCFEKGDRVGGNWVFKNSNGLSSAYRSLHINTSKARMQFRDFPMAAECPDYPHHSQVAAYFEAYAEQFQLKSHIHFQTSVERLERSACGGWIVSLERGAPRHYDAVAVANGHHWAPSWPDPPVPGVFTGTVLHAHDYVDPWEPYDLEGRRVVVVGFGNSAVDIATELSHETIGARVFLSVRRGAHVLPKYLLGKPLDQTSGLLDWLPQRLRRRIATYFYYRLVGRPESFGLPKPNHELWQAHPTVSNELLGRLGAGMIQPKPALSELEGRRVHFSDGSVEEVDAIIYCTGYRVSFPFLSPDVLAVTDNDVPLFRRVFDPRYADLFFFGLAQPVGAIMPIVEAQAKWVAEYLVGRYHLPSAAQMRADIEKERVALRRRYVASARHTMQIDFDDYLKDLSRERRAGAVRARRAGYAIPIPIHAAKSSAVGEAS